MLSCCAQTLMFNVDPPVLVRAKPTDKCIQTTNENFKDRLRQRTLALQLLALQTRKSQWKSDSPLKTESSLTAVLLLALQTGKVPP